jgi:hypothetical protein
MKQLILISALIPLLVACDTDLKVDIGKGKKDNYYCEPYLVKGNIDESRRDCKVGDSMFFGFSSQLSTSNPTEADRRLHGVISRVCNYDKEIVITEVDRIQFELTNILVTWDVSCVFGGVKDYRPLEETPWYEEGQKNQQIKKEN